jgi:hypothetical protein
MATEALLWLPGSKKKSGQQGAASNFEASATHPLQTGLQGEKRHQQFSCRFF